MIRSIAVVCMGNICRSPIAEHVLRHKLDAAGLNITVESAGTGGWHAGEPADPRAAAVLDTHGYTSHHRAQQFNRSWFDRHDLILVMDTTNLREVRALASTEEHRNKIQLMLDYDKTAAAGSEIPDPYYGGDEGFVEVLQLVERAADGVVARLLSVE